MALAKDLVVRPVVGELLSDVELLARLSLLRDSRHVMAAAALRVIEGP